MHALLWSDYICPWCYVAQDRTALLGALGVQVEHLPYELHPEIPREGRDLRAARPGGRSDTLYSRIEAECAEVGLPFRRPTRVPNSRLALEVAEHVRLHQPAAFDALDAALFRAHFVDGWAIDDPAVLDTLLTEAGADADAVLAAAGDGRTRAAVDESMAAALEEGVAGTPAYLIDGRLLLPGLQPRELYERIVKKMATTANG